MFSKNMISRKIGIPPGFEPGTVGIQPTALTAELWSAWIDRSKLSIYSLAVSAMSQA